VASAMWHLAGHPVEERFARSEVGRSATVSMPSVFLPTRLAPPSAGFFSHAGFARAVRAGLSAAIVPLILSSVARNKDFPERV
jgi:hypothetical protein